MYCSASSANPRKPPVIPCSPIGRDQLSEVEWMSEEMRSLLVSEKFEKNGTADAHARGAGGHGGGLRRGIGAREGPRDGGRRGRQGRRGREMATSVAEPTADAAPAGSTTSTTVTEPTSAPRVRDVRANIEHRPAVLVDGVAPFPVVDVNDKWLSTCSFDREDVVGQTLKILQGPRTEQEQLSILMRGVQERSKVVVTLTNYDGRKKPFRNALTVEPVEIDGRAYFLATCVITFLPEVVNKRLQLRDMSPAARGAAPREAPTRPPPQARPVPTGRLTKAGRGVVKAVGLGTCLARDRDRDDQVLDQNVRNVRTRQARSDTDPDRALRYAAWQGDGAKLRESLLKGAKVDAADSDGFSALVVAARWNRVSILQSLIVVHGADIDHRTRLGQTALDVAVEHGHTEAEEYLRSILNLRGFLGRRRTSRSRSPTRSETAVEEGVPPESALRSERGESTDVSTDVSTDASTDGLTDGSTGL